MQQTDKQFALNLLRESTNDPHAEFRRDQWECIDRLINYRESLIVVQRTGWGKSAVYFIATRILRDRGSGLTLIISPLLVLMRNQIDAAHRIGIRAETVNSTNQEVWSEIENLVQRDMVDAILISPERLANEYFYEKFLQTITKKVGLLVIDEIHCISDWGHDFRPDYRRVKNLLPFMSDHLILGTTATANDRVISDIKDQFEDIQLIRGSLMRESISLQTMRMPSKIERLAWLAEHIDELNGTGIIYTLTISDAELVAKWLRKNGVNAFAYYSNVESDDFASSDEYRRYLEDQLYNNKIKALVATTALGMGYDKPDLGFVVHYQVPSSIIAYYQQVGRAGRAIDMAQGIIMSGREDGDIAQYFRESAFPSELLVERILTALESNDGLSIAQLEGIVNLRRSQISKVLKFLSVEPISPVIKVDSLWKRTPVRYELDHDNIRRITNQRISEWTEIQEYIDEKGCLMVSLAHSLNQSDALPCGKCSNCLGRPVIETSVSFAAKQKAAVFIRHSERPLYPRKKFLKNGFPNYEFKGKIPESLMHETGRIMSQWNDPGIGELVSEDKTKARYRDEIVDAVVDMIRFRWQLSPQPTWVTCVGSRNNICKITDFARRLALALGLPYIHVIERTRVNEYQKEQHNSFHQCRNIDGVFSVSPPINSGPVLLVDDVYDSGWTLTVISALLRKAGSGPVFPLALAATTSRGS